MKDDLLKCLECGVETKNLTAHIRLHNMTSQDYKTKYNYCGLMQISHKQLVNNFDKNLLKEIVQYYIEENHSKEETLKKFNLSGSTLTRVLRKNNIKKSINKRNEVIKRNALEKYGVESVNKLSEKIKKNKETMKRRYGVECVFQTEEVIKKIKSKTKEDYKEIVRKRKETCLKKYGSKTHTQKDFTREGIIAMKDKDSLYHSILNISKKLDRKPKVYELSLRYGCTNSSVYEKIRRYKLQKLIDYSTPSFEVEIKDFLDKHKINYIQHDRKLIYPKELDFYLPDYNIGIEINDIYSHNSTYSAYSNTDPISTTYHQEKTVKCEEKGIRLIHLWEWEINENENFEKIKKYLLDLLKPTAKLYARKCDCREVPKSEARAFFKENHLQGAVNSMNINIGLYYDNELISCMSFGKPRFGNKYEYELLRFANKFGYSIVGAASRLFKHFLIDYNPKNIISYCDLDKFNGKVYEQLGFKFLRITAPTFEWCNHYIHYNWKTILDRGVDNVLGTNYGKGTNNEELMIKEGFVKVYNARQ